MRRLCECNPDDDCTCMDATWRQVGMHMERGPNAFGYWYVMSQDEVMANMRRIDYDTAMAMRALREYGYTR